VASSLTRSAPAFRMILVTGAFGNTTIFITITE
jgi:hypothetical protein